MESKDVLINNIKNWVKLDNEIRELKKQESARKIQKNNITAQLITMMKENEIDTFDIKDGQIHYNQQTVKKPINKKNLMNILTKYYNNDITRANEVNEFILSNREEVVKETIVRKINT
jgi:hypothetical protein